MDGHKHEVLSDETLQREIEAAFGVDPSPEFLPRVRARIADERMREGWFSFGLWRWASVLAGAMVLVAAGLWFMRMPAVTVEIARNGTVPVGEPSSAIPTVVATPPERAAPGVTPVSRERSPRRQAVAFQEVVISPDDAAALRQLVAAITARQVEARDIPALGMESAPLPPLDEIVVEPINISPLAALEGE